MNQTLSVCLMLVVATLTAARGESVYSDLKDKQHWFRTIIVPEDDIRMPKPDLLARRFLSAAAGRSLVVFSMFTDREDAGMDIAAARDSYQGWRMYYDQASKRSLRTAQAIAVNGDWALRLRQEDGTVTTRILAGRDPLRFSSDGAAFEILEVQPRVGTRFDHCEDGASLSPIVYVKTASALNATTCERAAGRLARLFGARKLLVTFRNDQWFISFGGFPVVYPFSANQMPPSEAGYYKSDAFTCSIWCGEKPTCTRTLGPSLPGPRREQ